MPETYRTERSSPDSLTTRRRRSDSPPPPGERSNSERVDQESSRGRSRNREKRYNSRDNSRNREERESSKERNNLSNSRSRRRNSGRSRSNKRRNSRSRSNRRRNRRNSLATEEEEAEEGEIDRTCTTKEEVHPTNQSPTSLRSATHHHDKNTTKPQSSLSQRDRRLMEEYPHRYRSRSRSPRRDYRRSKERDYRRSPSPYYSDESDSHPRRSRYRRRSPSSDNSRYRRSPRNSRRYRRHEDRDEDYAHKPTTQRFLYNPDTHLWYDQETGTYSYYDETLGGYVPYEEPSPYQDASIRLLVLTSDVLETSKLAIVDSDGLSLGRDRGNDKRLRLRELLTSKYHANIYLQPLPSDNLGVINPQAITDTLPYVFCIVDCGSQHGTFVNEQRLSEPKKASQPYALSHGDLIKVGSTLLEVHHHLSGLVCEQCRTDIENIIPTAPGSVSEFPELVPAAPGTTKRDHLEQERRQELKRLKRQFAGPAIDESRYCDRAALRRQANPDWTEPVGTSLDSSSAVVIESAPTVMSAGEKLLRKQGWQHGQGLGRQNQGIVEPIAAHGTQGRNGIGFGTGTSGVALNESLQQATRRVYRERFQNL